MQLQHLQSSTQIIDLEGIKVLTDPWLTPGETHGSWYHYPPFDESCFSNLEYDFIYVSHIHPDHLSERTFKKLPRKVPVLIHNFESKFVKRKIESFGFPVIECDNGVPFSFSVGKSLTIYAADNCNPELCARFMGCGKLDVTPGSTQIDTMALFESNGRKILNLNDCPFELAKHTIEVNGLHMQNIDLLLVGYAGAGPYPQCFVFDTLEQKISAAKRKEAQFLNQAVKYIQLVKPKTFAPFAGTYILGSRLSVLNEYRGMPSIEKAIEFLETKCCETSKAILLEQFDTFDLISQKLVKNCKSFEYSLEEYISIISKNPLEYDADCWDEVELPKLIEASYDRFIAKAKELNFQSTTKIIIETTTVSFEFSTEFAPRMVEIGQTPGAPFLKIVLDHNLLHRLVRGPRYSHWNNAEGTSHLTFVRKPDIYERELFHALCFFHA